MNVLLCIILCVCLNLELRSHTYSSTHIPMVRVPFLLWSTIYYILCVQKENHSELEKKVYFVDDVYCIFLEMDIWNDDTLRTIECEIQAAYVQTIHKMVIYCCNTMSTQKTQKWQRGEKKKKKGQQREEFDWDAVCVCVCFILVSFIYQTVIYCSCSYFR